MIQKENLYRKIEGMLYSYPKLKAEIENIRTDIEELNDIIGIKGASDNQIKPTTSTYAFNSNVENEVINRDETIQENTQRLQKLIRSKERTIKKIETALKTLGEEEYKLIEYRYFKGVRIADLVDIYHVEARALYKRKSLILIGLANIL